jgi:hypothetical protein
MLWAAPKARGGALICLLVCVDNHSRKGLLTGHGPLPHSHRVHQRFLEIPMRIKFVALIMMTMFVGANVVAATYAEAAKNGSGSGGDPFNCKNKPDQPKCKKK